jgi:hypothetical protein
MVMDRVPEMRVAADRLNLHQNRPYNLFEGKRSMNNPVGIYEKALPRGAVKG